MSELPKRKPTRLKHFDYSSAGAYFVTICTQDRKRVLSEIVRPNFTDANEILVADSVGEGLAPPEVRLTEIGKIAEEQLLLLENRYPNLTIDNYVIMPDHIHIIVLLRGTGGASPSPTVHDIVCTFKSLTSRLCKQRHGIGKMFQRSCAEHVIRDQKDYEIRRKYIYENPIKWYYKNVENGEG
ncbi:MAG: hypothetical protein IJW65_04190 [Clostridia bacterium]|nr:hypothetical protein [Clostridia bacterium]